MIQTIKFLIYEAVLWLAKVKNKSNKSGPNTILLVKTDELGDYMLFRNYLVQIAAWARANDSRVVFAGNALWKGLFEDFDNDPVFVECIWINKKDFKSKMGYRFRVLRKISDRSFQCACNFVVSRNRYVDDALMAVANTINRIGYGNELSGMDKLGLFLNRSLSYTTIAVPENSHDFEKHRYFLQQLTGQTFPFPALSLPKVTGTITTPSTPYVILFPGSGKKDKLWQTEKFVAVATFITQQYGYLVCLGGSAADAVYAGEFKKRFSFPVLDFCGNTSFKQLIELIQNSRFILTIDTGSVHVATACDTRCYAIFSGVHWGRFSPYPTWLKKEMYPVYPPGVEEQARTAVATGDLSKIEPGNYNDVTAEKVISRISQVQAMQYQ